MKIQIERDTFLEALTSATRAVATRAGALPVLSGVHIVARGNDVTITGSDLDLTIKVNVMAHTQGDGAVVLGARLVSDIVRSLEEGTVTLEVKDQSATLTSGRSSFTLRTLNADEYPRLHDVQGEGVRVEASQFNEGLKQVIVAASKDEARPILCGVLLSATDKGLRFVATDSYRLSMRDVEGLSILKSGSSVLVPAKGLAEVQRLLGSGEVEVILGEREVSFSVDNAIITMRLIDGEYPNYEQLIPKGYPNRVTISREALAEAVKRVRLVAQDRNSQPVRLLVKTDGVELRQVAQEIGEATEHVDAKCEGAELEVAFNSEYLLDGLAASGSEEVMIETIDPLKPATLRGTDQESFTYLLMPVRVS
jgi:DNA polymerase-3 subunit beta